MDKDGLARNTPVEMTELAPYIFWPFVIMILLILLSMFLEKRNKRRIDHNIRCQKPKNRRPSGILQIWVAFLIISAGGAYLYSVYSIIMGAFK